MKGFCLFVCLEENINSSMHKDDETKKNIFSKIIGFSVKCKSPVDYYDGVMMKCGSFD